MGSLFCAYGSIAYLDGIFARKALQRTLGTFFVRKVLYRTWGNFLRVTLYTVLGGTFFARKAL